MPIAKRARPAAPTRPGETHAGDTLNTAAIYHLEDSDLFLIVDLGAKPEVYDWVIVQRVDDDVMVALYQGQEYICVVRPLEFYPLNQSEQWTPRTHCDWT